jgi:flagellar P-ring protein FlgI
MRKRVILILMIIWGLGSFGGGAEASRIKDIARVNGLKGDHLIGYGLVVGLGGTGDGKRTGFTTHSLAGMMEKFGITLDADEIRMKNVAAVIVTTQLPPGSRSGGQLDVTVSSLGDASSLEGGILLMTPLLRESDGQQYAVAQGPLSTGGYNVDGGGGNSSRKNNSNVGRIPGGATLSMDFPGEYIRDNRVDLVLYSPDFTTAANVAEKVNERLGEGLAQARDASRISVWIPKDRQYDSIAFLSSLENLDVSTDRAARVVINERTGTIVVGQHVGIKDVAIAHGNLSVEVKTGLSASQPSPFGQGRSLLVPDIQTSIQDSAGQLAMVEDGNTVEKVAQALNELGVSPRDMISIFQALKAAGALEAELVIM